MFQTKLQDKTPERGLNETEVTNLFDKDFKIKVINMLIDLKKNIQDLREDFNKKIKYLQKSHSELKNIVSEMKHTMEGFKSRLFQVEEAVNEMEIMGEENNEAKKQRKKDF